MLKKDTRATLCRHCFAHVGYQMALDGAWMAQNPDGSRHACQPEDVKPTYQRILEHEAWDKAKPGASTLRANISEIAWELGYGEARDSISPRMSEMEVRGMAIRSQMKRVPGPGLSSQTVWLHHDTKEQTHDPR